MVPVAATMFMNFCALTLLLNSVSVISNIINPIIPPDRWVMIAVLSKALNFIFVKFLLSRGADGSYAAQGSDTTGAE
jgi:hypothetical protein